MSEGIKDDNEDYIQHSATLPHVSHDFSRYLLYCPIILAIHVYRRLLDRGTQGACMRVVRRVDWSQASRQRSASRAGMEKQHCMQGLRMDKARPTSLPRREVSLFGQHAP